MNNENFGKYGSRYETVGTLGKTEIAKAIRADLKFAQKLPAEHKMHLPKGIKVSVRCRFYAGGSSIDLTVTAFPGNMMNPARVLFDAAFPHNINQFPEHTREGARVLEVLKRITDQYNFDKSDIQTDYFHVNFYSHVSIGSELRRAMRDAITKGENDLANDIKVTIASGDRVTAERQIEAQNTGYEAHHYERAGLASLFSEVA